MMDRHGTWIASRSRDFEDAAAAGYGQAATLVSITALYTVDAVVSEIPAEHEVFVDGPHDENHRYRGGALEAKGVVATLYLPAKDLAVEPKTGDRLVVGARTFVIVAIEPRQIRGTTTSWRLDCGEFPHG